MLLLIGMGCGTFQDLPRSNVYIVEDIDVSLFQGNWRYVASSIWDEYIEDMDQKKKEYVTVSADVQGAEVIGVYTAKLRDQDTDEAVYTAQGSFTGLPIVSESDDGIFTIPEDMTMKRRP